MDVLVELVAPPAEQAVPVLDAHRGVAQVVILHRGDADDLVDIAKRPFEEIPLLDQPRAGRVQDIEGVGVGQIDASAGALGGGADTALGEAVRGRLDGVVGHPHLGGSRVDAQQSHQQVDEIGARGRTEVGRAVEGDVGFDQHHVARLHEASQSAEGVERLQQHLAGVTAAPDADSHRAGGIVDAEIRQHERLRLRQAAQARAVAQRQRIMLRRVGEIGAGADQAAERKAASQHLAPRDPRRAVGAVRRVPAFRHRRAAPRAVPGRPRRPRGPPAARARTRRGHGARV